MTISTVASRRDSRMGGLVLCFAPKNETFGFLKKWHTVQRAYGGVACGRCMADFLPGGGEDGMEIEVYRDAILRRSKEGSQLILHYADFPVIDIVTHSDATDSSSSSTRSPHHSSHRNPPMYYASNRCCSPIHFITISGMETTTDANKNNGWPVTGTGWNVMTYFFRIKLIDPGRWY